VAKYLGDIFHRLARERESKILEGHLCPDHVHMLIEIPPKYSVAQVVGYIKGKSAIAIARQFVGRQKKLHRTKLLGKRVLRNNGGTRRSDYQEVYTSPGSRG
jgi:putative transposase